RNRPCCAIGGNRVCPVCPADALPANAATAGPQILKTSFTASIALRLFQRHLNQRERRSTKSGVFAFDQRLNFVINLKLHWRVTGVASCLMYSPVQPRRFQFVGTQAFWAGDYQISRIVPRHEEWGNIPFLSLRPNRRNCQKPRNFFEKLLDRVMSFLQESVRQNTTWIFAWDVLSAHSYSCYVRKSLPHYRQEFKSRHPGHIQIGNDHIGQGLAECV